MIQAVLGGKAREAEYWEDILTSTVLGSLEYLDPRSALIPFVESAWVRADTDDRRTPTTLRQKLESENINLRDYREIEYVFWARHHEFGEPDLIVLFRNHEHGAGDYLLLIEVKFLSGMSGTGEKNQLVRYFQAIRQNQINGFDNDSIKELQEPTRDIVYLTRGDASDEIQASQQLIDKIPNNPKCTVFHLRWETLHAVLQDNKDGFQTSTEKRIAQDLILYLETLGLGVFRGISVPGSRIQETLSQQGPVFWSPEETAVFAGTFFSHLTVPRTYGEKTPYAFYRG